MDPFGGCFCSASFGVGTKGKSKRSSEVAYPNRTPHPTFAEHERRGRPPRELKEPKDNMFCPCICEFYNTCSGFYSRQARLTNRRHFPVLDLKGRSFSRSESLPEPEKQLQSYPTHEGTFSHSGPYCWVSNPLTCGTRGCFVFPRRGTLGVFF